MENPGWDNPSIYLGHGEWTQGSPSTEMQDTQTLQQMDTIHRLRMETQHEDLMTARLVREKGYPNMFGARIPVKSRWNIAKLEEMLQDYWDKDIVQGLKYGWPTGRLPTTPDPLLTFKNHKGATDHPESLEKYIQKEKSKDAVIGPFNAIPFTSRIGISPISTRPKKNSMERRVILDLSFPHGHAVNDGMIKNNYLGWRAELTFPNTDDLALRIAQIGKGALMFKIDLSRYFRQIPLDPGDYSMVGYIINGELYFDKVLPMGMRTAPYIAQRITNAVRYIHEQHKYFLLNYMDDFLGAEERDRAFKAFDHLTQLLATLRVETAPDKIIPPTTRIEFLGITFDSTTMTIEVTQDRVKDMLQELNTWNTKTAVSRREVESLIGKLQFASKCVRPGRTFISRLIHWIRSMNRTDKYPISPEARKDIAWWGKFLEDYNGVSIM